MLRRSFVRFACPALAGAFGLWLAGAASAATITIDFDVDPDGAPIASGSIVDSVYARYGVSFSRFDGPIPAGGCTGTNVYANDRDDFASSPNVVTTCAGAQFPSFNATNAWVKASLERDAVEVCVAVNPETGDDRGVLEIVDESDAVLDSVVSSTGVQETLCLQAAAIRNFRFAGDGRFATFDDLRITFAPNRIDFDSTADGTAIADGTAVDTLFESEGVSFSKVNGSGVCGGAFVYANDDLPGLFGSPPNGVSVCNSSFSDFSENIHGRVRADFLRRVSQVCVSALPSGGSDRAVLRGFDADGLPLAQTLSAQGSFESRICVTDPLLRAVEFAGYQGGLARFDDFDFSFGDAAIDFDTDDADVPIASGSLVNVAYQDFDVVFDGERVGGACGAGDDVYANGDPTGDFASSPNQVSLCPTGFSDFSENLQGVVHASFPFDAQSVCVEVRATQADDWAVLRSYDAGDGLLDEVTSAAGASETLCISGGGIRGVRFAGAGPRFARFDDLDVRFVPEPGAVVAGLAAGATLAGLRARRRRLGLGLGR